MSVFVKEGADPALEKFFSTGQDIREDLDVASKLLEILEKNEVKSLVMPDRIIGCAHEEGIDYPEGKPCPQCPFWAGRDRWTGDLIQ